MIELAHPGDAQELTDVTFNAPPDQINGLTLNNGDTLNVDQGGTVSNITVLRGGNLNLEGGSAVDTTLEGALLRVAGDSTLNGITFEGDGHNTTPSTIDQLELVNPGSVKSFTFGSFQNGSYMVDIIISGADITSIQSRGETLTVNFANQPSVTYHYNIPPQGQPQFTLIKNVDPNLGSIIQETLVPAPIVGVHHHETAFMPPIVGVHHHETAFLPPIVGLHHHETAFMPPIVGVHHHETAFMPPIVGVHHHETAFIHFGPGLY